MYEISKDLMVNENVQFDAGIHSGVTIEKISYENVKNDGTGKNILAFHFKGSRGETFRHVEWPIEESDANLESKVANMGKRIKHILSKFVPEESIVIGNVNSFEEYANEVILIAGTAYKGRTFEIKLLLNDSDKLCFPKYVGFIAKEAGTLKLRKDEKIVKSIPTNVEEISTFTTDAF